MVGIWDYHAPYHGLGFYLLVASPQRDRGYYEDGGQLFYHFDECYTRDVV